MANNLVTAHCPHCNATLEYDSEDTGSILCPCCDSYIAIDELAKQSEQRGSVSNGIGGGMAIAPSSVIDDSDSALAYLENYFETLNWDEFKTYSELTIPQIDEVVEKIKIKNAASPKSWLLEFNSIYFPVSKKIEGISEKAHNLADKYSIDNTDLYQEFDVYKRTLTKVIDSKDQILRVLKTDIEFAKRFGLDKKELSTMESNLKTLNDLISKLAPATKLEFVPEVEKKIEKQNSELTSALKAKGIDAEDLYKKAVLLYYSNRAYEALDLFVQIDGYRDAHSFIKKINSVFEFNSLIEISGRRYILAAAKDEDYEEKKGFVKKTFNVKSGQTTITRTYPSLYEIVNGKKTEEPVLKKVGTILFNYGATIFYLRENNDLDCYDANSGAITTLIAHEKNNELPFGADCNLMEYGMLNDSSRFYILRKRSIKAPKKGCFKKPERNKNFNFHEVYVVDMAKKTATRVVNECNQIFFVENNKLFYLEKHENDEDEMITSLYLADLDSNKEAVLFEKPCEIEAVNKNCCIFSEYSPVTLNKTLYIKDFESGKVTLLEKNIYDYVDFKDNKIFYTIGNSHLATLYSIELDGSNRHQILRNPRGIYAVQNGWIYIMKGFRRNSTLIRVPYDGSKVIVVATGVKFIVEQKDGYTYYIDYSSNLRCVRNDGKENKILSEEILANTRDNHGIIIEDDIYCLRNERVSETFDFSYSIYKMDLTGNNDKKVAFDVKKMKEFDDQTIYYFRNVQKKYKVITTVGKNVNEKKIFTTVGEYVMFNKDTEVETIIYSINKPENVYNPSKGCGCLKSKASSIEYEELPIEPSYERQDKFDLFDDIDKNNVNNRLAGLQSFKINQAKGCFRPKNNNSKGKGCGNGGCGKTGCGKGGCLKSLTSKKGN